MSTGAPGARRRSAGSAKRSAIVEAAVRAFFDRGFAATSIEQIAANAGVSKVTIYNHFGDKRGLFVAAVETECERLRGYFSIGEIARGSLRDRLLAIGEAMVAFLSRPELIRFDQRIAAETAAEPEIGRLFLAAGPFRMKQAFTRFLQAMAQAGEIELDDFDLAAEQFVSMCKGMGDMERRFGQASDPERDRARIEGAVELFCSAYGTSGSGRHVRP